MRVQFKGSVARRETTDVVAFPAEEEQQCVQTLRRSRFLDPVAQQSTSHGIHTVISPPCYSSPGSICCNPEGILYLSLLLFWLCPFEFANLTCTSEICLPPHSHFCNHYMKCYQHTSFLQPSTDPTHPPLQPMSRAPRRRQTAWIADSQSHLVSSQDPRSKHRLAPHWQRRRVVRRPRNPALTSPPQLADLPSNHPQRSPWIVASP